MLIWPAEKKEVQYLDIHYLDVPRIKKYFSQETHQGPKDLIARIVGLYNRSVNESGGKYEEIALMSSDWKTQTVAPFQICVYGQEIPSCPSEYSAETSHVSTAQTAHHLFFLYREEEIFALTTDQSLHVIPKEINIDFRITAESIAASHLKLKRKGEDVLKTLMQVGYLSKYGMLTSKFIQASKEKFEIPCLKAKSQRDCVYDLLKKVQSQFDSTIPKIELIHLKRELENLGFGFKVLQIQQEDYSLEEKVPLCEPLLELPEPSKKEWAETRRDVGEGDSFTVNNQAFRIVQTEDDGACALHALLGKKVEGKYFCDAVREKFVECLKREFSRISGLWKKWMVGFLKDYIANPSSVNGRKMFDDVKELKKVLDQLNQCNQTFQSNKEQLYIQICQSSECQKALKGVFEVPAQNLMSDLKQMNNTFDNNLDNVLLTLAENDLGQQLMNYRLGLDNLKEIRENLYETVTKSPWMFDVYIKGVSDKSYYFSTQELEIAAHLFDKYVVVYDHLFGDQVRLVGTYGNISKEPIIMFHKGLHFSRCEEEEVEVVIKKRKQEE